MIAVELDHLESQYLRSGYLERKVSNLSIYSSFSLLTSQVSPHRNQLPYLQNVLPSPFGQPLDKAVPL